MILLLTLERISSPLMIAMSLLVRMTWHPSLQTLPKDRKFSIFICGKINTSLASIDDYGIFRWNLEKAYILLPLDNFDASFVHKIIGIEFSGIICGRLILAPELTSKEVLPLTLLLILFTFKKCHLWF